MATNKKGYGFIQLERFFQDGNYYISLSSSNSYPFEHIKFGQKVEWLSGSIFRRVKNTYISNPNLIKYKTAIDCDLAIFLAKQELEYAGYDVQIIDKEFKKLKQCMVDAWRAIDYFETYDNMQKIPVQQFKTKKELVVFVHLNWKKRKRNDLQVEQIYNKFMSLYANVI